MKEGYGKEAAENDGNRGLHMVLLEIDIPVKRVPSKRPEDKGLAEK